MAVEDHPRYDDWSAAVDRLKEANDRYRDAKRRDDPGIEKYRSDLRLAQEVYERLSEELG